MSYSLVQLAQKLYEGVKLSDSEATGLITYMRTDGLHVSASLAHNGLLFNKLPLQWILLVLI